MAMKHSTANRYSDFPVSVAVGFAAAHFLSVLLRALTSS